MEKLKFCLLKITKAETTRLDLGTTIMGERCGFKIAGNGATLIAGMTTTDTTLRMSVTYLTLEVKKEVSSI